MADTPTPAAAPPAAKPAAPANPAASFDARIALAKSLGKPRTEGEAPAPAPVPDASQQEFAEPATETEAPAEAEAAPEQEEATEETETDAAPATDPERITTALAALEKSDIEGLVKALGGDPKKIPAPTKKAFGIMARKQAQLDRKSKEIEAARQKAISEVSAETQKLTQLQRHALQKHAPFEDGLKAWDNEDYLTLGKALEKAFKTDLATFTQKLASGKTGKTAEERALADAQKKNAELEARLAKLEGKPAPEKQADADEKKVAATKREVAVSKVGEALKTHPYLVGTDGKPDTEALEEVFAEYEKSWNGEKFTKTARQVADELQAKLLAKAEKRGLVKKTTAPPTPTNKPPVARTPRLPEPPPTDKKNLGTPESLDASRAHRIALVKRQMEMQKRGVR